MTTHVTKTWIEDGKILTQVIEEKYIYKSPWVGLTEQEVTAIDKKYYRLMGPQEFAKEIEAALRGKNT